MCWLHEQARNQKWKTVELFNRAQYESNKSAHAASLAYPEGDRVSRSPLENHNWLQVSLEILVRTPLEKQLDHLGPIASRGRSVRPSVKYVDHKKRLSGPPLTDFSGSAHEPEQRHCWLLQ